MPQTQPRQQLTPQDSQMLQRQLLLKQFQEHQKHRLFPQSADETQQNNLIQQSEFLMSANTMPHGTYAPVQGLPNEYLTQPRRQDLLLANNINPRLQGQFPDSAVASTEVGNNQAEKSALQSLYGKPFLGVNQNIPRDPNSFTDGAFQSKKFTNGKNMFGQVQNEGFQQANSFQMDALAQGFGSGKEQKGSFKQFQGKTTNMDSSQSTTLDPLEQKFLFGMDENEGNWSALMQSAVESSSDDGVVQEEWSGLNFQNTEAMQQSPKVGAKWIDSSCQQAQPAKGPQHHTVQPPFGKAFPFQGFQLPNGNAEQRNKFSNSDDQTSIPTSFGVSSKTRLQHVPISQNLHVKYHMLPHQNNIKISHLNVQGSHNVASTAGSIYMSNQQQSMYPSAPAVNAQPTQVNSPYIAKTQLPYDLFILQGASKSNSSLDHVGKEFPILETLPVDSSRRSPSIKASTVPLELPSDNLLSSDPKTTDLQAPQWVTKDQHVQNVHKGRLSQKPGAGSTKHLLEGNGAGKLSTGVLIGRPHQANFDHSSHKQVPSVSVRDFEAFGRSLKPSNLHLNHPSSSATAQKSGTVSGPSSSIFSNKQSIKSMKNTAGHMALQSQYANGKDMSLHKTDHSQGNTQKVSRIKQYGGFSLRNGLMLSMSDKTVANDSIHPSPLGKQMGTMEMKAAIVPLGGVKLSAPCTSDPDLGGTDSSKTVSRKRKTATSDLIPWHMEVTKSSKRLQSISMAEMEWTNAANRLVDKVDIEVNVTKDVELLLRLKKRLVLSTQLMQLILKPVPAAFLRANAALNYDSVAYFSAKLALGDACHLNSWSRDGSGLSGIRNNMFTEDSKASEKITEKHVSTVVKDFTSRAEKLETDFLRLDRSASLFEVTLEHKEVEKYSQLQHLAKYYNSGQQKAAETSTSSGSNLTLLKPGVQKYVTVVRVNALPAETKCLSL